MSKKKKEIKGLERKITSLIISSPKREFNYKQIAFSIGVNDTKGRSDIIKVLNTLLKKEKISLKNIHILRKIEFNTDYNKNKLRVKNRNIQNNLTGVQMVYSHKTKQLRKNQTSKIFIKLLMITLKAHCIHSKIQRIHQYM